MEGKGEEPMSEPDEEALRQAHARAKKIIVALRDGGLIKRIDDVPAVAMALGMLIGMLAAAKVKSEGAGDQASADALPWIEHSIRCVVPTMLIATADGGWADNSLRQAILKSPLLGEEGFALPNTPHYDEDDF